MKSSVIHVLNPFLQQSFKKHIHTIHDHTNQSMETPLDMEKLQKIQSMLLFLRNQIGIHQRQIGVVM